MKRVKFQVILLLGDNLGLNGMLGFVGSFKANHWCRICKVTAKVASMLTIENESALRTKINYIEDVHACDTYNTGIKEECAFHKIPSYNLSENVSVDMMHDLLEGVCVYVMRSTIHTFIFVKKYFTLQALNNKVQQFEYGYTEIANKPPVITINRLKNKLNLKISAAEMLCLVRYFGLMVGHCILDERDEHWQLYKYLRRIIDIVTSPRIIVDSDASDLQELIHKHHTLYIKLYGNLKPKFHILLHYPRLLLQNGPVIHFWSMRFESNHSKIKANAQSSSNNKNLLVSVAIKQTLKMCEMMHNLSCESTVTLGSKDDSDKSELAHLFTDIDLANKAEYYKQVDMHGTLYKIGVFLVVDMQNIEKDFGEVMNRTRIQKLIKYENRPNIAPCLSVKSFETRYVASRYYL